MTPPPSDVELAGQGSGAKARSVAKASLGVPAVIFVLLTVINLVEPVEGVETKTRIWIRYGGLSLLALCGICLSVYALASIRRFGREGLLIKGVTGLIWNTLFFLIFFGSLLFGFRYEQEREVATQRQFLRSMAEIKNNMRPTADTGEMQEFVDSNMKRAIAVQKRAAADSAGVTKAVHEAGAAYMEKLRQSGDPWVRATDAIIAGEILLPSSNGTREEVAHNRTLVKTYIQTTLAFSNTVHHSSNLYRAELKARPLSEADMETAIRGFNGDGMQNKRILKKLEVHGSIGHLYLTLLDLAEQHIGQWHEHPETGTFLFPDATAQKKYEEFLSEYGRFDQLLAEL